MNSTLLHDESLIRAGMFLIVLILCASLEAAFPKRRQTFNRFKRWPSNLALVFLGTLCIKVLLPYSAVTVALSTPENWGLFKMLALPYTLQLILSLFALDLIIYWQHRLFHTLPWAWRIHRMHHSDLDFDVTTGVRFHPLELILSMLLKMLTVAALGVPALAILIFEIILNATSLFNHSNLALPEFIDNKLRLFIVTPDMHRVHHSAILEETNSNFGFNFPWWDKLFKTYRSCPLKGHQKVTIGLNDFRNPDELRLDKLLTQPFRD